MLQDNPLGLEDLGRQNKGAPLIEKGPKLEEERRIWQRGKKGPRVSSSKSEREREDCGSRNEHTDFASLHWTRSRTS